MVSPSARPRPSIVPPMMPPRPNGRTTVRIMPQRVAPSASAASFSPGRRLREHLAHHRARHRQHHHGHGDAGAERAADVARLVPHRGVRVGVDLEERDPAEVLVQPQARTRAAWGMTRKKPHIP